MRRVSPVLTLVLMVLACSGAEDVAFDLDQRLDEEIARLETTIDEIDRGSLTDSFATRLDEYRDSLEALRRVEAAPLRLYELRDPFVGIETIEFLSRHRESGESIERLERLWEGQKPRFETAIPTRDGSLRSALMEVASTRSERLFQASLQYGKISSPSSGLYYLAQAEGNRRYLDFLSRLPTGAEDDPVPDRGALLAAAEEIESEARALLNDDLTSRAAIPVSVRLDESREMIERGRLAGATLQLLEARLKVAARREGSSEPEASEPIDDHASTSLRLLFSSMAASESREDSLIARRTLLPLYDAMLAESPAEPAPESKVTLTLVRWPYT